MPPVIDRYDEIDKNGREWRVTTFAAAGTRAVIEGDLGDSAWLRERVGQRVARRAAPVGSEISSNQVRQVNAHYLRQIEQAKNRRARFAKLKADNAKAKEEKAFKASLLDPDAADASQIGAE